MPSRVGPRNLPLYRYLRDWREYFGWTQERLAVPLNTSKGVISRWERGKRAVDEGVLTAIAEAYGTDGDGLEVTAARLKGPPPEKKLPKALPAPPKAISPAIDYDRLADMIAARLRKSRR